MTYMCENRRDDRPKQKAKTTYTMAFAFELALDVSSAKPPVNGFTGAAESF